MPKRHSPIKERPLRTPGQSIEEDISRIWLDEIGLYAALASISVVFPAYVLYLDLTKARLQPLFLGVCWALVLAYCVYRIRKAKERIRLLTMASEGEKTVAEVLDELRVDGAAVFHDIPATGFNVDHLVIARQGVFVIETKTRSKFSDSKVMFDGERLLIDGMKPIDDPIAQVKAISDWVVSELARSTGKRFPVQPVVLFPGWYVEHTESAQRRGVWVLSPKALPAFVRHSKEMISDTDLHLISYHTSRIVRVPAIGRSGEARTTAK